jgi:hypothetical protein
LFDADYTEPVIDWFHDKLIAGVREWNEDAFKAALERFKDQPAQQSVMQLRMGEADSLKFKGELVWVLLFMNFHRDQPRARATDRLRRALRKIDRTKTLVSRTDAQ